MKRKLFTLGLLAASFLYLGCSDNDDDATVPDLPTAAEFTALQENALEARTQHFTVAVSDGWQDIEDGNGVRIMFDPACLRLNGNPVTGNVEVEFVSLFTTADMLVTNRPTMGRMPGGDLALLISGGEFFLNVTQNGQPLTSTCNYALMVPTNLTGGNDNGMTLWEGEIGADGQLVWDEIENEGQQGGVFLEGNNYYLNFGNFGWTNVDRWYNDPRPKTTLLVGVPDGYDNENSAVYLSYDGEGNALATLDTFTEDGYFSEHYGQIPIGLECHVIFVTEEDGGYRYAIKAATIEENGIITFTYGETVTGTEAQLVTAIEAVQD